MMEPVGMLSPAFSLSVRLWSPAAHSGKIPASLRSPAPLVSALRVMVIFGMLGIGIRELISMRLRGSIAMRVMESLAAYLV